MNYQLAIEYYNNGLQRAKEEKWDEALEFLNKAIAEDPKHVNSYNVLGKVYVQKGELNAAKRCWRMALRIDPDNVTAKQCLSAASKRFAQIRIKALLWPAAVVILIAALIITNSMLLRRISNLETELAKATAVKAQEERKAREPESQKAGSPASSIQGVTKSPKLEDASQVKEAYDRALEACTSGQYDQAIEMFQQILEYPPAHQLKDNAQYWLAECYYAQRKYIQALAEFQKVKEYFPKADKVFDAELKIAYTYYKLGRIEEAKQKLSQLSKDWPHQQYRSRITTLSNKISSDQ